MSALLNEYDAVVEAADKVVSVDLFKDIYVFPWQLPCDGMFYICFIVYCLCFVSKGHIITSNKFSVFV